MVKARSGGEASDLIASRLGMDAQEATWGQFDLVKFLILLETNLQLNEAHILCDDCKLARILAQIKVWLGRLSIEKSRIRVFNSKLLHASPVEAGEPVSVIAHAWDMLASLVYSYIIYKNHPL
ncbi:hypothetical protein ACMFMG_000376 [Clarireedia jacksonii]